MIHTPHSTHRPHTAHTAVSIASNLHTRHHTLHTKHHTHTTNTHHKHTYHTLQYNTAHTHISPEEGGWKTEGFQSGAGCCGAGCAHTATHSTGWHWLTLSTSSPPNRVSDAIWAERILCRVPSTCELFSASGPGVTLGLLFSLLHFWSRINLFGGGHFSPVSFPHASCALCVPKSVGQSFPPPR